MSWSLALVLGASVVAAQVVPLKALRQAEGTVEQIDLAAGVLRVKSNGSALKLLVTRSTTIFVKGHAGTPEELTVGSIIRGAYEGGATGGTLQWVEVAD
ncbi:MAG: hypothetical protein ACJ790_05640 [Myxococcaceae bacterium]